VTPKSSFSKREGKLLGALLIGTLALFIGILVVTWIAAERAHPVFLELETGKPVQHQPAL